MQSFAHLANVLFLVSFLVRDILWLRVMSIVGGFALIPYYLYGQAEVLWVPFSWNLVFMTINAVQIYRLILERRPVRLTAAERRLHELVFASLTPRAFSRLVALADWRDADSTDRLVASGAPLEELMLVSDGRVAVRVGEREVATLEAGRFVGEMSFLTGQEPSADVVAMGQTSYLAWPCDDLRRFLEEHPEVRSGLQLILGTDLARKLRAS